MRTEVEFQKKYSKLKDEFIGLSGELFIPAGNNSYRISKVTDNSVVIKQGKTPQPHLIGYLKALFIDGHFWGPKSGVRYDRSSTEGHLHMKNAIVNHLIQL